MKKLIYLLVFIMLYSCISAAEKRAQTVEDMWAMKRIIDISLSPKADYIAYSVKEYDMKKNTGQSNIWIVSTTGENARQLTTTGNNTSPAWNSDGTAILYLSDLNGTQQIYELPVTGGQAEQLTNLPVDVESFLLSPDGKNFAFTATVFAEAASLQESAEMDQSAGESQVKAKVIDHLFYRYWNAWRDGKYTHVFVCAKDGSNILDLTPGAFDAPPLDLGSAQDFTFSPDGTELAFVSNHDAMPAASTNNDIFIIPVKGGNAVNITENNKAVDNSPRFSPDGTYIAYKAMERAGFESDQYNIILYNRKTGEHISLTEDYDRSPDELVWTDDSKTLLFNAEDLGRKKIYSVDIKSKKIKELVSGHFNNGIRTNKNSKNIFYKQQSAAMPDEIFSVDNKGVEKQLTFINADLLSRLAMNPVEDLWFSSFDGAKTHCLIVKPPFFDSAKKYPMVFLIHGGPQGMWGDDYHYRWNTNLFAAPGYVVAMINFRGSHGYGQVWCDKVTKDWGGGPYQDLMTGLDYLTENLDYIDKDKVVAAGASYGGYMINWIATHNNKFKALVSHSGVFDVRSKYGATEELWFPEWEFGGTPYANPELYEKWSPSYYVENLAKFKTPTLVIHGQNDFRVDVTQGMQFFTALQKMDVPSRFIYFPDECHFITKPQNARLWWNEIFKWYDSWLNK